ncbi:WXG100 family type VII secretion target [Antrihabitans sp. YC2-6]|uniref:WXG100 family type VII secretion target n=1 Tax=Antrihabitans sp. YC2-6 TaxID=2799498 RepID=UPI0018F4B1FF|nr:WXG100 family type VII secretion target [Antrihabitans sp. YC2-6]MBJ8347464.1 WXG100 family type VII secretion target [Antrihabitans sp. YC2-6]
MASGQTTYKFPELHALAESIDRTSKVLDDTQTELRGHVNTLRASWTSENAAIAYDQVQADWDKARMELNTVLATIARVVRDGTADMQTTEDRNATSWLNLG